MKILSIDNFTTKVLSRLLSDIYILKEFGSKVIERKISHRKTVFHMK